MLRCSTSLWSADLARLADEIRRIEPFTERFHLDVADGTFVPALLFFPDLVRALRPHTAKPFEVHLMTMQPLQWIDPFVEAGADSIIFCHGSAPDPLGVVESIHARGKRAGVSLSLCESPLLLDGLWPHLDILTLMGTEIGIKGVSMDLSAPARIKQARGIIAQQRLKVDIEADGGIRRETVPLLAAAGCDYIVPGSLMFGGDPRVFRDWLASLPRPTVADSDPSA